MKRLLIMACLLLQFICTAQDTKPLDDQIKARIQQLKTQRVETVVCYYAKCDDENDDPYICSR